MRVLPAILSSAADFTYAGACIWFSYLWFQYDADAMEMLMVLRNWIGYELMAYLVLMALALLIAPDVPRELRLQRSVGEWLFLAGFLLFMLLLSAAMSWLVEGTLMLLYYLLAFLVVRSMSYLMEGGFKAFDGLLDLAGYLRLAIIPLFAIGTIQVELLEWHGMNWDPRILDAEALEEGALQLSLLGFWFYLGYGVYHFMRFRDPGFLKRVWPASEHFFEAEK